MHDEASRDREWIRELLTSLDGEHDAMAAAMERMDPLEFGRQNQLFHHTLYDRCPNDALVEMVREDLKPSRILTRAAFEKLPSTMTVHPAPRTSAASRRAFA